MSTSYGMAGWRVGFVVGNAEILERINLFNDHCRVGIFRPIQEACIAALAGPQDSVAERRDTSPPVQHNALWEGPIFLPGGAARRGYGNLFVARLAGPTDIYPFAPGVDVLKLAPAGGPPALRWLAESGFVAREWHVRGQANHARSKTFRWNCL